MRSVTVYFLCFLMLVQIWSTTGSIDEDIFDATDENMDLTFFQSVDNEPVIQVELDMMFTPKQWLEIQQERQSSKNGSRGESKRKALRGSKYRWPNATIPYDFVDNVYSAQDKSVIHEALDEWQKYTCVSFRPATSRDRNFVRFDTGHGCASNTGMIDTSPQHIKLAPPCRKKKIVVHEVGHTVGFKHEQTRPDRDEYVRIVEENIPPNVLHNFEEYTYATINTFGVPYDYRSIMHYGSKFFSWNGEDTIETTDPKFQNVIGNGVGLSFRDIKAAHLMYSCNAHCSNKDEECPGEGFVDKSCKCMCPGSPITECTGTGTGTGTKVTGGECTDRWPICAVLADDGLCEYALGFTTAYCKKSCKICSKGVTEGGKCKDTWPNCVDLASSGLCTRLPRFLNVYCKKSCKICKRKMIP